MEPPPPTGAGLPFPPLRSFSPGPSPVSKKGSSYSGPTQACLPSIPPLATATWRQTHHQCTHPCSRL